MEHLVDSLGYLLKAHGPAYLPIFDTVTAPVFAPLLASSQPVSLRWALVRDEKNVPGGRLIVSPEY